MVDASKVETVGISDSDHVSCIATLCNGSMPITGGQGHAEADTDGSSQRGPMVCVRDCMLPLTSGQANLSCLKVKIWVGRMVLRQHCSM